jgi:hypothetical protein
MVSTRLCPGPRPVRQALDRADPAPTAPGADPPATSPVSRATVAKTSRPERVARRARTSPTLGLERARRRVARQVASSPLADSPGIDNAVCVSRDLRTQPFVARAPGRAPSPASPTSSPCGRGNGWHLTPARTNVSSCRANRTTTRVPRPRRPRAAPATLRCVPVIGGPKKRRDRADLCTTARPPSARSRSPVPAEKAKDPSALQRHASARGRSSAHREGIQRPCIRRPTRVPWCPALLGELPRAIGGHYGRRTRPRPLVSGFARGSCPEPLALTTAGERGRAPWSPALLGAAAQSRWPHGGRRTRPPRPLLPGHEHWPKRASFGGVASFGRVFLQGRHRALGWSTRLFHVKRTRGAAPLMAPRILVGPAPAGSNFQTMWQAKAEATHCRRHMAPPLASGRRPHPARDPRPPWRPAPAERAHSTDRHPPLPRFDARAPSSHPRMPGLSRSRPQLGLLPPGARATRNTRRPTPTAAMFRDPRATPGTDPHPSVDLQQ